jgi:hypothetical protein
MIILDRLEILNKVLENSLFCVNEHGTNEDEPNYYYIWFETKENTKDSYLLLAELANKLALILHRTNIYDVKIELMWCWANVLDNEGIDTNPSIQLEVLNKDLDKVMVTMSDYGDFLLNKFCKRI